jgi:hypothetical protein
MFDPHWRRDVPQLLSMMAAGKAGVERNAEESAPVDRVDLVAQVTGNVRG